MMNILAVDTSTKDLVLALSKDGEVITKTATESLQHSKILFGELEELLQAGGVSKEEIDIISVNLGPGSFTGIRIGVVFAKGMGYALGTKLVGADAFVAIATEAKKSLPCGILCEERGGGGYFAIAKEENGEVKIFDSGVYKNGEIQELMQKHSVTKIISNASSKVAEEVVSGVHGLISIAETAAKTGEFASIEQLEPVYIKKSQAEEQLEEKERKNAQ